MCVAALSATVNPTWLRTSSERAIEVSPKRNFDLNRSLTLLFQQKKGGSRDWNGWMVMPWLRLRAASIGGSHSGTEADATLILAQTPITPTLTAETGHYGGGDAFARIRMLTQRSWIDATPFRSLKLEYQTGYLGAELTGRQASLSINVGLTRAQYSNQSSQGTFEKSKDFLTAQIGPALKFALSIEL
jgi:hypothetical protein